MANIDLAPRVSGYLAPASSVLRRRLPRVRTGEYLVFALVCLLVIGPLAFVVYASFSAQALPSKFSFQDLTLRNYETVFISDRMLRIVTSTAVYVVASVFLSTAISLTLAYFMERTDLPFRNFWFACVLAGFAMPSMVQSIAWILLIDPAAGSLNRLLGALWDPLGQLSITNIYGMVFVQAIHAVPLGVVMFGPLLRNMDASLEAAASVCGAGVWVRARTVTLKLLVPGVLGIMIYQGVSALDSFEIPGVLGAPGGVYVFSTYLYGLAHPTSGSEAYNLASTLGIGMMAAAAVFMYFYFRVLRKSSKYATLSGKGFRHERKQLGRWRPVAALLVAAYVVVSIVLPFLIMLYASFLPYLQPVSMAALGNLSLESYQFAASGLDIWKVARNTLLLAVGAASLSVFISMCVSYVVVRGRSGIRKPLDALAFMPHGVPGLVAGVAFFLIYLNLGALGSLWGLVLAFAALFIAYGTRSLNAVFLQIHPELEDAARTFGIPRFRRMVGIVLPLAAPSLIGLWIIFALLASRVVGTPLMLASGSQEDTVLAVALWTFWTSGNVSEAAALGTILMLVAFTLTMLRHVPFMTRRAHR